MVISQPTWSLGTLKAGERRAIQLDINPKANGEVRSATIAQVNRQLRRVINRKHVLGEALADDQHFGTNSYRRG